MAEIAKAAGTENHVVGKVFILYGTVKAISPDGTEHALAPNSPIYADDHIITDSDGSVSIQFDGPPVTQLDLGRMTEIVIDQDVYAGVTPEVVSEAAAQAEQVQESLLAGDQPIDLEATAAGGTTGAGGAHPVVHFDLTGGEVTPGSGADTTGTTFTTVDTTGGVFGVTTGGPYTGVVTLTATDSVTEADGQVITYTATVDNAPLGSNLLLTLNNGGTITILAGEHTGSVNGTLSGGEDVYVDPGSITASITGATGGNYTTLDISDTATTNVTDTIDTTTVTLATSNVTENDAGVTFTATLSNPGETAVTVHTDHGDIAIAAGETHGTLFVHTAHPDVYIDPSSITATVSGVSGGNFEAVDFSAAKATAHITDTIDTTTVSLSGPGSVNEGASAAYTVSVDHAPQTDMTVDVSYNYITADTNDIVTNTTQVTIQAGHTSAQFSVDSVVVADDQIPEGTETFAVSISNPQGGNFENLVLGNASVSTDILDTYAPPPPPPPPPPPENQPPLDGDETHTMTGSFDGSYFYPIEGTQPITGNALLNASDPDGDPLTVSAGTGTINGTYGDLTLASNGDYTYTLHSGAQVESMLEAIRESGTESATETFHYTVSDGHGGFDDSVIIIHLNEFVPENQAPVAVDDTGNATELGITAGADANGNVLTNDTDDNSHDALYVSQVNGDAGDVGVLVAGAYGSVTIHSDGSYTYVVDNANVTVDALNVGGTLTDSFTYQVSDGQGGTDTATLTITINGTDDAPVAHADFGAATEAGITAGSDATGNVLTSDTDVDNVHGDLVVSQVNGADANVDHSVVGAYGSVTINTDGSYTYVVDNANVTVDALNVGGTLTDSFTYQVSDGQGGFDSQTLTITIHGTDDAPVVEGSSVTVSEEALPHGNPDIPTDTTDVTTAHGTISISDVDDTSWAVTLSAPGGTALTSGGKNIVWTGDDSHTLIGHAGSSEGAAIVTIGIDNSGHYDVTLSGPLDHPNDAGENTLHFDVGVNVDDQHGGSASGSITVNVEDDIPVAYDNFGTFNVNDNTISDHITINTGNTVLATGIGAGGMVNITVDAPGADHGHATLNFNSNEAGDGTAFGITSDHDGNASYSAEINYMDHRGDGGDGQSSDSGSEVMIFELQNGVGQAAAGKIATHATVDINVFYAGESGVGDEVGSYSLYNNGHLVQGPTTFTANSTGGTFQLSINGPLGGGGFDEIHFSALLGTDDNPGGDSSDYNVKQITFDLVSNSEHGNLLTGSDPDGSFGADGGHVDSIAAADTTHLDNVRTTTAGDYDLQVTGKYGGTLMVNSDNGDYIYTPPAADTPGDKVHEIFSFTLIDGDGDTAQARLDMLIDDPDHPHPC